MDLLVWELQDLINELNEDLHDKQKVIDWLTFLNCPRKDDFRTVLFLEENLHLFKIQRIVDLVSDLSVKCAAESGLA